MGAFGAGKNFRYVYINALCNALGEEKSVALPFFHSFTGCDTTSGFFGKGKKSSGSHFQERQKHFYMYSEILILHLPLKVNISEF